MDAKLEVVKVQQQAHASSLENKIDNMISAVKDGIDEFKTVRWWMAGVIVTVALSAVATIIGVYSGNASIVQSVIAAFQAGQSPQTPPPPKTSPPK